ncbi:hypothetical protein [Burkholderia contaminans]|uniref:hypothetical protein n=1 Tax=Burkholderia contaminans TaxID=488447 RepID=UPI0015814E76|nr:hypothetical protein [Burkholderia contaminans]
MSSRDGCMRCRSGFRRSAEQHDPASPPALNGPIESDSDSHFRFDFHAVSTAFFARPPPSSGNAFRLRTVTKNCLPCGRRIAYIAIHLDTFVACPGKASRPVDIAVTPDNQ